jgi:hypothetical protein
MRNATEIVKHVDFSQPRPAVQQQPASIDEGTAQVVNALFNELKSIFPAWKQAWPDDEALKRAKRSWIKGLMAAGIHSLEQIRFGLMTCRASGQDFAPSVGKFVEWCQPTAEQLGLPPTEKAFQEAASNSHPAVGQGARWSHPAVHHAATESGLSNLFRLNEDAGRKLFERNYSIACRMVAAGQPLREIPKALPAEVSTPAKPETVQSELAKMRAALGRRS